MIREHRGFTGRFIPEKVHTAAYNQGDPYERPGFHNTLSISGIFKLDRHGGGLFQTGVRVQSFRQMAGHILEHLLDKVLYTT